MMKVSKQKKSNCLIFEFDVTHFLPFSIIRVVFLMGMIKQKFNLSNVERQI
jgi:hypothetical protein